MERRLAAILAADVVGYSRLMGEDEAGTLSALLRIRKEFIEPLVAEHRGRVVKLMGDGILAEFASVVDAVNCAVAWQNGIGEQDLQFRIGVNLGDVIIEDGDIYGNGVNVAARLEGLSEPGGICLTGDAYRQVRGMIEAEFEDLGEQDVKNVAEPVRVYRIATTESGAVSAERAGEPLTLPDKPSIAVLPFTNISSDTELEFFADGMTEEIITALSRVRWQNFASWPQATSAAKPTVKPRYYFQHSSGSVYFAISQVWQHRYCYSWSDKMQRTAGGRRVGRVRTGAASAALQGIPVTPRLMRVGQHVLFSGHR